MTWEEYYEKMWEWKTSTKVRYISKLTNFGPSDEVMEAIVDISFDDSKGATRLLKKAIDAGVKFNGNQLIDMYGNCDESELERAVRCSADEFTDQDIEDLYCSYEDELVLEVAKQYGRKIPDDLREWYEEEQEELDDAEDELEETEDVFSEGEEDFLSDEDICEVYDAVLECLWNAHDKMTLAYKYSGIDLSSSKSAVSIIKHALLIEAEEFIDRAQLILDIAEPYMRDTVSIQNVRLDMGNWISFLDTYGDGFLLDWMVRRRIKKMLKSVEKNYEEIRKLRDKL